MEVRELVRQADAMVRIRATFAATLKRGNLNKGEQKLNKDNRSVADISQ
jgi:hypothetical protein